MSTPTRRIADRQVFPIALGSAAWSFSPSMAATSAETPDERSIATIHAAIDHGITVIDTARAYTTPDRVGHCESLIARALATHSNSSEVVVATKGGHDRQGFEFPIDASADTVRRQCETSLELLGVDRIWLYQLHWPDPRVGVSGAITAFAELREEGLIEHIGVSNFTLDQLDEARRVADIASLQNRFSPSDPGDRELLAYCQDNAVAYLVHSPFRGLTDGSGAKCAALRSALPGSARLAEERGVSIHRLLLAWMLAVSSTVIPICGASRPESIRDSALASDLSISREDFEIMPVFEREGGWRKANLAFGGALSEWLVEINEAIAA